MDTTKKLIDRIVIDPDIMVGKPVIKGTRLTVQHILDLLMQGITIEEILQDYTNLIREDVYACFAFANSSVR